MNLQKQLKTVALYDSIETMVVLPELFYFNGLEHRPEGISIVAGGENGKYFFVGYYLRISNLFYFLIYL